MNIHTKAAIIPKYIHLFPAVYIQIQKNNYVPSLGIYIPFGFSVSASWLCFHVGIIFYKIYEE